MHAYADDGSLLSWGLNQHGQCGVGILTEELRAEAEHFKLSETRWVSNVCRPLIVKGLPPIAQVSCGWSHVLAVSGELQCCNDSANSCNILRYLSLSQEVLIR